MVEDTQRRLTAIVAADIAGYSRLVGADEEGTLAGLRAHRDVLIDGLIGHHGGRVANTAGDSILMEFPSAVDAVRCAIAIQQGMAARNIDIPPESRIEFRMGINVGDVIAQGGDLLGDGVNIAARLEELSEPGGIALSSNANEYIEGKIETVFSDDGAHEVKNMSRPIRLWRWHPRGDGEPPFTALGTTSATTPLALPDKPSIAVLPFDNMSGDPEQVYFSDGISEDIITALSHFDQFLVIARNSSFTYKGRAVDLRQVARELGVQYVLEGSVRRAGNRVRITAQLIDATSGNHLWAERYDRELDDIFAVQDEITAHIASALGDTIHTDHRRRSRRKDPANLDAYDKCLQAAPLLHDPDRVGYAEARRLAEEAIALDPDYAQAHAIIALTGLLSYTSRWGETSENTLQAAFETARHAVALDDHNYLAHAVLGYCLAWQRHHDLAVASMGRATALNPNDAFTRGTLTNILVFAGQSEEALEQIDLAMRLNPHYPGSYPHFQGRAFFTLRRYEEAEHAFAQAATQAPGWPMAHLMLAAVQAALGKPDAARAEIDEALKISPDLNLNHMPHAYPYRDDADLDHLVDMLRLAGLPE